jgi:hypothetical protein
MRLKGDQVAEEISPLKKLAQEMNTRLGQKIEEV